MRLITIIIPFIEGASQNSQKIQLKSKSTPEMKVELGEKLLRRCKGGDGPAGGGS